MGFMKLLGALMLAGFFMFSLITFFVDFANENSVAVDIEGNDNLRSAQTALASNWTGVESESAGASTIYANMTMESGDETTTRGTLWKSLTAPLKATKNIFNIATVSLFGGQQEDSGGLDPKNIGLTLLGAFLLIATIAYGWKAWKGNPD